MKIGWTKYVHNRVAKLERETGEELYLWACVEGTRADERRFHARWEHLRLGGEWFRTTDELIAWAEWLGRRVRASNRRAA